MQRIRIGWKKSWKLASSVKAFSDLVAQRVASAKMF